VQNRIKAMGLDVYFNPIQRVGKCVSFKTTDRYARFPEVLDNSILVGLFNRHDSDPSVWNKILIQPSYLIPKKRIYGLLDALEKAHANGWEPEVQVMAEESGQEEKPNPTGISAPQIEPEYNFRNILWFKDGEEIDYKRSAEYFRIALQTLAMGKPYAPTKLSLIYADPEGKVSRGHTFAKTNTVSLDILCNMPPHMADWMGGVVGVRPSKFGVSAIDLRERGDSLADAISYYVNRLGSKKEKNAVKNAITTEIAKLPDVKNRKPL
jgi:hypothetical protein